MKIMILKYYDVVVVADVDGLSELILLESLIYMLVFLVVDLDLVKNDVVVDDVDVDVDVDVVVVVVVQWVYYKKMVVVERSMDGLDIELGGVVEVDRLHMLVENVRDSLDDEKPTILVEGSVAEVVVEVVVEMVFVVVFVVEGQQQQKVAYIHMVSDGKMHNHRHIYIGPRIYKLFYGVEAVVQVVEVEVEVVGTDGSCVVVVIQTSMDGVVVESGEVGVVVEYFGCGIEIEVEVV